MNAQSQGATDFPAQTVALKERYHCALLRTRDSCRREYAQPPQWLSMNAIITAEPIARLA